MEIGRMVSTWIAQAGKESGLGERAAGYTKLYSPLSLFASSYWNSILHYLLLHSEHNTPDIQYLYSKLFRNQYTNKPYLRNKSLLNNNENYWIWNSVLSYVIYHLDFDTILFALLFVFQASAQMSLLRYDLPDHSSISFHNPLPLVTLYHISVSCHSS